MCARRLTPRLAHARSNPAVPGRLRQQGAVLDPAGRQVNETHNRFRLVWGTRTARTACCPPVRAAPERSGSPRFPPSVAAERMFSCCAEALRRRCFGIAAIGGREPSCVSKKVQELSSSGHLKCYAALAPCSAIPCALFAYASYSGSSPPACICWENHNNFVPCCVVLEKIRDDVHH